MSTSRRFNSQQLEQYRELGYVANVPIFSQTEVNQLFEGFDRLCQLLHEGETPYVMDGWEKYNSWLFELVTDSRLLDCVEDILGPNFYQWGSNFMSKRPYEGLYVPWHQDAHDWPLLPLKHTAVWLALDDVDDENGCLRVIPGSHRYGFVKHHTFRPPPEGQHRSLLPFHLPPEEIDEHSAVSLQMQAGQISLHHPLLMHSSPANDSARRRCGLQICYAATEVKCDTSVRDENGDWTSFSVFLCRGEDKYHNHEHARPPTEFGRGPRKVYRELKTLGDN